MPVNNSCIHPRNIHSLPRISLTFLPPSSLSPAPSQCRHAKRMRQYVPMTQFTSPTLGSSSHSLSSFLPSSSHPARLLYTLSLPFPSICSSPSSSPHSPSSSSPTVTSPRNEQLHYFSRSHLTNVKTSCDCERSSLQSEYLPCSWACSQQERS